MGDSVATLPL